MAHAKVVYRWEEGKAKLIEPGGKSEYKPGEK